MCHYTVSISALESEDVFGSAKYDITVVPAECSLAVLSDENLTNMWSIPFCGYKREQLTLCESNHYPENY